MEGVRSVAYPGRVSLFARSSGTTSDRSKSVPVTMESLWWNQYAGHARRGDGLFGQLSEVAGFRGQDPDAGRLVQPRGAQPGGGPLGAADPRDDVLERLVPGPADRDGDHSGFRREGRGDLPRVRRRTDHGLCGRAVVESGDDAPRAGIHRQTESAGGVARSGDVRPRGRGVRALPGVVRGADPLGADEIHGDLQRLGGFFALWPTILRAATCC